MRKIAENVFRKCLESVEPRMRVAQALNISSTSISINNSEVTLPISQKSKFVVIGFGKAVLGMSLGALDKLPKSSTSTFLIAPKGQEKCEKPEACEIGYAALNNLPDTESIIYTENILRKIDELDDENTIFIFLISGGGSALLSAPIDGVQLSEKLEIIKVLVSKGATIQELNLVRQRLSKVKGGGLLRRIRKGKAVSLIISDIIDNPLNLIASGPTVPQNGPPIEISEILKNLKIEEDSIKSHILQILQTPIQNGKSYSLINFSNHIISSNSLALNSIYSNLPKTYSTHIISSSLCGNASELGRMFSKLLRSDIKDFAKIMNSSKKIDGKLPMALIFGGETTVILKGQGKGGRNQEMVLACLDDLKMHKNELQYDFCFLSAGTDGQDGPTDAAGSIISTSDIDTVLFSKFSTSEYLSNSDSYNFWAQFNSGQCHLKTGPTGTNVMDIQILLIDPKK